MWRKRVAVLLIVAVAAAAFATNPLVFPDRSEPDVSAEARYRLKTQFSAALQGLHPRHVQVVEARMTGPTPDDVEGRVVFRTLFGVPAGVSRQQDRGTTTHMYPERWAGAWLGFLTLEAAVGLYLLRQVDL